jgi:hypothetical protein
MVLVLIQAGIGMYVNLYVTIPLKHPGANPPFSHYLGASMHSLAWAISHGSQTLVLHAVLGLALAAGVIATAVYAIFLRRWGIGILSVVGGLMVILAGFKGLSFLDFQNNSSSIFMALLAFGSIACYAAILYLLTTRPQS